MNTMPSSIASFPTPKVWRRQRRRLRGRALPEFFRDYVSGVEEIPYDDFFQFVGLHVVARLYR